MSYAISVDNKALATSGNYRKFKIDSLQADRNLCIPSTLKPDLSKKSDVLSASVVAETCAIADAYATAFMAMGFEKAKVTIEKYQNQCIVDLCGR